MIERQRILLSFVYRCEKAPTRTQLMKWLFLLRHEQSDVVNGSYYEFVPYHYGPFSFQAYRDIAALEDTGILEPGELCVARGNKTKVVKEIRNLERDVRDGIGSVLSTYGKISGNNLIEDIYERYPWYASRSKLNKKKRSKKEKLAVYTVGYEGRSIDGLLDHLLRSGIKQLIDVRKNAMSRKYGFAGTTMARLTEDVGIDYVHIPDLGISGSLRVNLSSDSAYEELFDQYEQETLPKVEDDIVHAANLCLSKPSVLMCFEASIDQCHRGRLAPRVAEHAKLEVRHL